MSENPTQYSVLDPRPRQGNFLAKGIRKMVGRSSKSAVVSSGLTDTGSNSDNSQFTNLKLNPKTDPSRIDFQAIPYDSVRNSKEPTKVKILPQRGPSVISLTSGSSSFTMQTSHKRQSGSSEDRSIADATNPIMAYPSPSLYPSRYHSNASSDSQIHCSESRDFYEGSANGSEVSFGSLDPKPFRSALQRSDRASQSNEELMIGSRAQSNIIREQRLSMPTLEVGAMGPPIPKYSKKASSEHSRYNPQRSPKEVNCSPTFSSVRREPGSSNGLHSFEVVSSNVNTIPPVEVVDALFKKLLSSRVFPQQSFQNISTKRKWELLLSENETNMDFDLKMLTMQFIPPINESKVSDTYTKVASKLSKKLSMSSIGKNFSASFTGEQSVSDSATLSAFSKKFKIKEGSPKWYVSRIMANKLTVKEYRKLSKKLESKSSSGIWTHGFQDAQGVTALTVILQRINKRSIKSNDDIIREQHICHCLKSLLSIDRVASVDDPFRALEIDDKSSVTSKSSFLKPELLVIDSIMHSLISPSSSTRLIVTELLVYLIHSSQFDYHQHILDGFTSLQDAMGEFVRYQPWLNVFETAIDQHFNLASSQRSTNEKKFKNYALTTLILINSIIQKSMYVNDRNHSRKEFSDSRLPIIFNKLEAMKDENISQQILEYETVENEDYSKVLNDDPPPNFTSVNENYTWGGVRSRTEMGFETHQAPTNLNIYSSTSNINSILKRLTRLETSKPPQDSQKIFTLLEAILDHTASNSNSNFDPDSVLCLSVERLMDRMETDEIARRAVMEAATLRKTIKRLTAAQQKSAQGLPLKFDERNFVDLTCSSKPQRNSRYSAQQPIYEDVVSLEETTQLKASDYVTKNSNSNGSRLGSPDPNLSDTNIHHDIDVSLEEIGSVSHQESQRSNSAPFTGAKSARVILELDDTEIRNSIACSIETNISAKRNTFSGSTATVRETSHLLKTNDTSSMNLNDHSQICPISNETNTAEIIKTLPDGIHTTKTEEASSMSISGLPPPPPPPPPPQLPGFLSLEGKETNEKEVNSEITPSCNPPPPPPPLPPMLGIGISQGLSSPPPPPPPLPLMLASLSAGSGSQSSMTPPPPPPLLPSLSFLSPQHSGEMSVSASPPPPPPLPSMSSEKQRLQQNDESTTSGSQELEKQNSENTLGSAEIEIRPKTKLKQMHWSKIDNIDKTFWSRVPNKEIIDELNSKGVFQELEKAFVAKSSVVKVKTKAHNISTHKCQKISILPRDLAQQFGINLHMFGSFTVEELMRKILQCDESITENVSVLEFFNSDALNEIPDSVARAFIPYSQDFTRPDMTPSKSSSNLERADQIFLGIFNMRSYWKSRSRALLIMQSFRKDSSDLLQKLDMVHRGASCIQQSENLRRVLALIRSVGNFLNDSSKQAKGFKIDILQRLKFMKDDTNSVTFLHYIERIVRNNFPEYGSFVDELSLLNHTQRIAIEQLEADCEEFKRNVLNVNTSMTKGNLSEIKKFHPEDEILKCIERSIDSAKQKVLLVETRKEKTISLYCDVMNYYGESPSDSNSKNSFFAKFSNFVMEFRKVHAENVQKEEDERMYERKKQMIERKEKILQERTNVGRHQGKRTRTKNVSGDSKVAHAGYTEYVDDDDEVDDEDDEDDEVEEYQTARADKDSRTSESIDELLRRLKYRSPLPAGQKGRRNRRGNMFYESKSHDVIMTDDELGVRTDKISNEYEKVKSLKRRMTTRKNIDFSTQDENAEQYDVVMLRAQAMLSQLRSKTHERELRDINEKPVELETEKFG